MIRNDRKSKALGEQYNYNFSVYFQNFYLYFLEKISKIFIEHI